MRPSRTGLLLALAAIVGAVPSTAGAATLRISETGQDGYTNDTRPLIQGTASDNPGDDGSLTLEVGQPGMTTGFIATVDRTGDTWSHRVVEPLAEGTYKVTASQWHDGDLWRTSKSLYIDLTPPPAPVITLASSAATADGTPIVASRFLATFATPSEAKPRYECAVDSPTPIACSKAIDTLRGDYFTLTAGEHVLSVRAVDQAGNAGPFTSRRLLVAAPAVRIAIPFGFTTSSANIDLRVGKRVRVSSSGHFKVPIRNRNGFAVGGQLAVRMTTRPKTKSGGVRAPKQLALRTRKLAPSSSPSVDVALSRSARRLLRTAHKLRVRITLNVVDARGATRVVTAATTLVS